MASEAQFLTHALIMGVFITFLYDCLRVWRRVCPHNAFWVSVEDILFWVYCAQEVFLLMYRESNGKMRWFAVAGALAGMLFYKKYISPLFVKYMSLLLCRILLPFRKAAGWMLYPVRRTAAAAGGAVGRIRRRMRFCRAKNKAIPKKTLTFLWKKLKMNL